MIERPVDFERLRRMRCRACRHEWHVDAEWLDRFHQALEPCPRCGTDCQSMDRPDFWAEPDDPTRDAAAVSRLTWYHTSTLVNWPNRDFDPAAGFTDITRQRMDRTSPTGDGLDRWVARQRSKALHVGTYEAAIESMYRRMRDQGDAARPFHLYRIELTPDVEIAPGIRSEPTDWMGDAQLPAGVDVLRYVNVHEDPSSVSLAITIDAVHAVQSIPIPLPLDAHDPWIIDATARLIASSAKSPRRDTGPLQRWRSRRPTSELAHQAREVQLEAGARLPLALRDKFTAEFDEAAFTSDPGAFPTKLRGLARLVTNPQEALHALDAQPWRTTAIP